MSTEPALVHGDVDQPDAMRELAEWISVRSLSGGVFRGWCHNGAPRRAMGGQVIAQALAAAAALIPLERTVNSVHGTFMTGADTARPVEYRVTTLREGRTYTTCRVEASQGAELVFTLSASFKDPGGGPDRHCAMPSGTVPPEELPDVFEGWAQRNPEAFRISPYAQLTELRIAATEPASPGPAPEGRVGQSVWMRSKDTLPDDSRVHAAALAYLSDITLAHTSLLEQQEFFAARPTPGEYALASLDHSIWFHRPFRADDWLLYVQTSPTIGDGRSLSAGQIFDRDGVLVASTTQEAAVTGSRKQPKAQPESNDEG